MNESQIKDLWNTTNQSMEKSMQHIMQNHEDLTKQKAQSLLSSVKPYKWLAVAVGLAWVIIGGYVITYLAQNALDKVSPYFLFSASLQIILTAIALVIYIFQTVLLHQTNLGEPILDTQKKLASIKSASLWIARVLLLQLPLWTTFYWSQSMINNGNALLWCIQLIVTLSLLLIAVWLFFNIKYENKDKSWFRLIFKGQEWEAVISAMALYQDINDFKKED